MNDLQKRLAHAIGVSEAELSDMAEAAKIAAAKYIPLLREARDTIEALRGEVARLTVNGIHTCHDKCPRLPCVQGREIRRLKGALEFIDYHISRDNTEAKEAIRKALAGETT